MTNNLRLFLISIPFLLSLASCTRDTYVLNTPNPTLFEKKGEKQLQIHLNGKSIQPQWGMSVTDKFAYQVNTHLGFKGQAYVEGLGGYFANTPLFGIEMFTGMGYGHLDYTNSQSTSFSNLEYVKVHTEYLKVPLQLNISFKSENGTRVFLAQRLSYLHYSHFFYDYGTTKEDRDDYRKNTSTGDSANVPSASGLVWDFGFGIKAHRWMFQMGSSFNWLSIPHYLSKTTDLGHTVLHEKVKEKGPYYLPFYITVGYSIDFGTGSHEPRRKKGKKGKSNGEDIL